MRPETGGKALLRRDGTFSSIFSGGDGFSFQGISFVLFPEKHILIPPIFTFFLLTFGSSARGFLTLGLF